MKKFTSLLGLIFLLIINLSQAQETGRIYTHEMMPWEKLLMQETVWDFTPTEPPGHPVRIVAEFEEMQGVLIRYPFGIPMTLIKEMAEDCKVKTIVATASQQQTVLGQYEAAGVNTANCEWLIAPSDSYWTRDYGPWFVVDSSYEVGIMDFPYNRPTRPNDDNIPVVLAQQMGLPLYGMELIHTGGNWMDDGIAKASSTTLVYTENPDLSEEEIDTLVSDYLGIDKYHVLPDPLDEYIEHIDCWAKFLDVDKVLVGQVPQSDYRYADYEYVANYFALQTTSYGNHYQVYRVYTPGNYPYTPYTNSLILNKKVFVPITGSQYDDQALAVYEDAMPGYEIIGILHNNWENTDALHCRAKGIADAGMLYIDHMPLLGEKDFRMEWDIEADIIPYSGYSLKADSTLCYYKMDDGEYQAIPLQHTTGYHYSASIPAAPPGSEIAYYLHTADNSGRSKSHPYIGAPDPHVFTVGYAGSTLVDPDSLIYLTFDDMMNGKTFNIYNYTGSELTINDIEAESFGLFRWYIDPFSLELPYTMTMNEVLPLTVKIDIPISQMTGYMVTDTLDIIAEDGHYKVVIKVDSDLISGLAENRVNSSFITSVSPNPFSNETKITFSINEETHCRMIVSNVNGQAVKVLADENMASGSHEIRWNGTDDRGNRVQSGIYLVKLITERGVDFRKLVVSY